MMNHTPLTNHPRTRCLHGNRRRRIVGRGLWSVCWRDHRAAYPVQVRGSKPKPTSNRTIAKLIGKAPETVRLARLAGRLVETDTGWEIRR